jgi:outer membrane protein
VAARAMTGTVVLSGLVMLAPGAAAAQETTRTPLTLSAAVGAAAATAEVGVARTAYLPRLDLLWQANRATRNNVFGLLLPQSTIPAVSGPVLGSESLNGVWSSAGGLLFSWEAVDFGRRRAGVDVASAEARAADAHQQVTELEIASAAADAYLAAVAADVVLGAARANVERLDTFANTVRVLVKNELRAGAELSRAEAELAAARNRQTAAARDAELARITLAETLGVPNAPVDLAPGALLQSPPRPDGSSFDFARHPRAAAVDAETEAVRARDRVLDRSSLPRVEVQTAVSGRAVSRAVDGSPSGSGLGLDVPNWAVGVSVTVPSLEIFRTQAKRRVEAERLSEATAHYDQTLLALQTQDARARAVIAAAYQIAANTPQQLQAARDSDTQARARYEAGLTNALEVAEAQRLLAEAESDNAVAQLAVWRAILAASVLRGDVQDFMNQVRTSSLRTTPNQ